MKQRKLGSDMRFPDKRTALSAPIFCMNKQDENEKDLEPPLKKRRMNEDTHSIGSSILSKLWEEDDVVSPSTEALISQLEENNYYQDIPATGTSVDKSPTHQSPVNAPVLSLIDGLTTPLGPNDRVRGAKNNNQPLPRHVLYINRAELDPQYQTSLSLHVFLIVCENQLAASPKIIEEMKKVEIGATENQVSFTDLVVRHATHRYGNRPFYIEFSLQTSEGKVLGTCKTVDFFTRTKRGDQKKQKRSQQKISPFVSHIRPTTCHIQGDELLRVYLGDIPMMGLKAKDMSVTFGNVQARVHAFVADRKMIICDIPPSPVTSAVTVQVKVSLDGKTNIPCDCLFSYHV